MRQLQATTDTAIRAAIDGCPAPAADLDAIAENLAGCAGFTEGEVDTMVAPYITTALAAAGILR